MLFTPTQKRAAAWTAIAALAVLALWALGPVLTPFVVAGVFAYALAPLVERLANRMPRVLAVLLVELLAVLVVLAVVLLIVPVITKEIPLMRQQLPLLVDRLHEALAPWFAQFGVQVALDFASLREQLVAYLNENWGESVSSLLASVRLGGSVALAVVGSAILVPVALFYLLLDWPQVVGRALELVPPRARPSVESFTAEANQVLGQWLRGQLLVMVTMAIFFSTGLAMFVPYVGFGIGLVLAFIAGLLEFASARAVVMVAVVYGIGQVFESLYLTPRIVGERIGLHPLVVIFALLAFGQLLGFVGVLVALPASAVLLVAIRRVRAGYLASRLYQG